jgi:4-hydroxybenzoate polyprenyltransferase
LTVSHALVIFAGFSFLSFLLLWWLNPLTRILSVAAMLLAVLYPFTKRFFKIPQLFMGVAFGWGAIMAWTAIRNRIDLPAVLIFLATLCWAMAYDTIYAMIDREDDARIGVRSSALLFGRWTWIATGLLFGFTLLFLLLLGLSAEMGPVYYLTLPAVSAWFLHQTLLLKRDPDQPRLFSLFKSHVGVGWLLLIGIVLQFHLP